MSLTGNAQLRNGPPASLPSRSQEAAAFVKGHFPGYSGGVCSDHESWKEAPTGLQK